MPQLASLEQVRDKRTQRDVGGGHYVRRTDFMVAPKDRPDLPQAFLIESTPGRVLNTHFHEVDQFQIVIHGGGTLSRHRLAAPGVHFARAFTPYGPITNDAQGIGFMTLRARRDVMDAQFISERRWRLDEIADRKPWQFTQMPQFSSAERGLSMQSIEGLKDERGLDGWSLVMAPNAETGLPDPSTSDGQYVVVLKGEVVHEQLTYRGLTVIHVAPEEKALRLRTGESGLEAIVLNFPRRVGAAAIPARIVQAVQGYEAWHCSLCDFIYEESDGRPEEGIAPGTRWTDVPHDWTCPDCAAGKGGFGKLEF